MNCAEYQEWISLRLDGQLDGERTRDLAGHLEDCPQCRTEETAYRLLGEAATRAWAPPEVDEVAWERVWQGVRDGIRTERGPRTGLGRGIGWAAAAAAAVVAVAALSLFWLQGPRPEPDRLALLRDGAVSMELVQGGTSNYMPVVTTTEGDVPVVYVYEVRQ